MMDIVDPEDLIQIPYCGPKNMSPLIAYTPFINLNVEDFVFMKLCDLGGCLHTTVTLYGCHNGSFSCIP
jgi:hypothetical protein